VLNKGIIPLDRDFPEPQLELEECFREVFYCDFFYYTVSITRVAVFGHCWNDFGLEWPLVPTYYGRLYSLRHHISVGEMDMAFTTILSLVLFLPAL